MTNTAWPSDEDVRKALVALHGHADVFPVHYEQARQALLAGTEGLRAAHDRQIAAKDEAIIALRERTPPMTDTPTPWVTDEEIVDLMADLPANPDIVRDGLWQTRLAKALIDLRDARATIASQAEALAAMKAENERLTRNLADTNHEFRVTVLAYEDQEKELAAAEAALKAARETLQEVDGCFEAALAEGWADALASGDIERITDLFNRRIVCARTAAVAALTKES